MLAGLKRRSTGSAIFEYDAMVNTSRKLVRAAKILGNIKVYGTEQNPKGDWSIRKAILS